MEDDLDRGIGNYTLAAIDDKWLFITVDFKDPFAISKFITDPDILEITILKPDLFISVETGLRLKLEDSWSLIRLEPQTTQEEYKAF